MTRLALAGTVAVNNSALTHGIQVDGSELYTVSMTQVLLYKYNPHPRSVSGNPTVIVDGLPVDGDLPATTLLLDPAQGATPRSILVFDGLLANIDFTAQDPSNGRSQIRRFALGTFVPPGGYQWAGPGAELLSFGIRNPAGLSFGPNRPLDLWAVENGASLNTVIGDNASTNNPADELEFVSLNRGKFPRFFGFPFCSATPVSTHSPHLSTPRAMAALNQALEEVKQVRVSLMNARCTALASANYLAHDNQKKLQLPNEILNHIARYVHPRPISYETANTLKSSGGGWNATVLRSSLIRLDPSSVDRRLPALSSSSPAKVTIQPGSSAEDIQESFQALLPFRARWYSLDVLHGADENVAKSLLAIPCPTSPHQRTEPGVQRPYRGVVPIQHQHHRPSPTSTFLFGLGVVEEHQAAHPDCPARSRHPLDFSSIAPETPFLSDLTIIWKAQTEVETPIRSHAPPALFPKLRNVMFVQDKPKMLTRWLYFAFGSLDGSHVEDLSVYVSHFYDWSTHDDEDFPDEEEMMNFLGNAFPSVKRLGLRAIPGFKDIHGGMLDAQTKSLEWLVPDTYSIPEPKLIFPQLTDLSLEFDYRERGVNSILRVLDARRGPSHQEIQSLTLFTDYSIDGSNSLTPEFYSKVQVCVKHLTVCEDPTMSRSARLLEDADRIMEEAM